MKALTYRDRGNGTTTYIDRVEDDYHQPHATPNGVFLEMKIIDDSLYQHEGSLIITSGNNVHFIVHSSRRVTHLDEENTFFHLMAYNKKLHELYDTTEASARFNHILEGLKVSAFNFLQWVIDRTEKITLK